MWMLLLYMRLNGLDAQNFKALREAGAKA
jgi:hypothetical protein